MALASTGYVILGYEATGAPGTAAPRVTANYKAFPAEEAEIVPGKEFIDFREIRGSRQAMITLDGPFRPTVSMKGALYPLGATGYFLAGTFGKVTSSASGGVTTHVFSDGATLPTFTVERSDALTSAKMVEQITGCKVESLQLACAFGEKADLTVNFQATNKPTTVTSGGNPQTFLQANSVTSIPTAMLPLNSGAVVDPVIFSGATVKWALYNDDGTLASETTLATIKSVNVEFTNTLSRQETLNGQDDGYKIFEGGLECTLSGALVFEDLDMYNRMMSGKPVAIRLTFKSNSEVVSGTKHEIDFYWPRVKVSRASLPFTAGEVIESDVEFKVLFDQTTSKMVEVTLKNADATTAYVIPASYS